jgi:hypothetical protein
MKFIAPTRTVETADIARIAGPVTGVSADTPPIPMSMPAEVTGPTAAIAADIHADFFIRQIE